MLYLVSLQVRPPCKINTLCMYSVSYRGGSAYTYTPSLNIHAAYVRRISQGGVPVLQNLTQFPFRVVDEINQGMDARNGNNKQHARNTTACHYSHSHLTSSKLP